MKTPDQKLISVDQLQEGLFVCLEEHWLSHPFLLNNFKLKNKEQIATIKQLGLKEVLYIPEKSDRPPLPLRRQTSPVTSPDQDKEQPSDLQFILKQERMARLKKIKQRIASTARRFSQISSQLPNLMGKITMGSKEGMVDAQHIVQDMVDSFLTNTDSVMHLMDAADMEQDMVYHFLNVSVISLTLGDILGLPPEELQHLGMGALLHDLGKMRIPKKHWRKARKLISKSEWELVKHHPAYGLEIAKKSGIVDKQIFTIIAQHHERMDGFGYPSGIKGDNIDTLAKITTIANIFDNLCNHYDPAQCMAPDAALQYMFKEYDTIIDLQLFTLLVKRLGIYPPGSIVQLSNDVIGKVMAANPGNPLSPLIMPYTKGVPVKEAVLLDLTIEKDMRIKQSLNPAQLPSHITKYLQPKARVSYFMEQVDDET